MASFGVGYFMLGMGDKEILYEFPASIVPTIIGVTYFFDKAQRNGSIDIIVKTCVRLVRGQCCCPGCSSSWPPRWRCWPRRRWAWRTSRGSALS